MANILVAEDDEQVRVLTESFLREQGHTTLSAATLEEAIAVLEDTQNKIEVLFTDVSLQGDLQAGLVLAQKATEINPDIDVLYTAAQGATDGMKAMFVDESAFLPKPYTVDQLQTIFSVTFGAGFGSRA
jgi:DNA-binding NtrC family response regulator